MLILGIKHEYSGNKDKLSIGAKHLTNKKRDMQKNRKLYKYTILFLIKTYSNKKTYISLTKSMQYSTIISLLKVLTTYHSKIVQVKTGQKLRKPWVTEWVTDKQVHRGASLQKPFDSNKQDTEEQSL